MNNYFSKEALIQGRKNQAKSKETPNSFAVENGASVVNETNPMDRGDRRMAGYMGDRALTLMNNPQEAQRTKNWMNYFGMSVPGAQFNQAKMGGAPPEQG